MQKQNSNLKENYVIGVGFFPFYAFFILFFGLFIQPLINSPSLVVTLIVFGVASLLLIYVNSLKIILFDDGFSFKKEKDSFY